MRPDEDFLSSFAAQQQNGSGPGRYDDCEFCDHPWHGLPCTHKTVRADPCPCLGSWGSP